MYIFTQTLCHEQDATQRQFLRGVQLVLNQSFPCPRLVTYPKLKNSSPVGCRICRLHLYRGVRPPHEYSGYDTQLSDGKAAVLQIWGI